MAPIVQETARIFEDPEPVKSPVYKRAPFVGDVLRGRRRENSPTKSTTIEHHGHASPSPLGERHINSPPQPKRVPLKDEAGSRPAMHKKTQSSSSLKAILMGRERSNEGGSGQAGEKAEDKHKKTKSSTNLVGLLKKRSRKDLKENIAPTEATAAPQPGQQVSSPSWLQLATESERQSFEYMSRSTDKPRTILQEIELYTPKDYSEYRPSEQRNFQGYNAPDPDIRPPQRPFLQHKSSRSSIFTENLDDESEPPRTTQPRSQDHSIPPPSSSKPRHQKDTEKPFESQHTEKPNQSPKKSSRILDTIVALNLKTRKGDKSKDTDHNAPLSPQDLDSAMEMMLGKYDVPQNLRDQLRNLKPEVKAGLMKGDRVGSGSSEHASRDGCYSAGLDEERPGSKDSDGKEGKRSRSRSRTRSRILSFSKRSDASPTKHETAGRSRSKSRPKSADMGRTLNGKSISSTTSLASVSVSDSAVMPGDFIHYLREVQKPELVEVGKLHKLRILLRNEAVTWTDAFVKKGGMDEIVQLLYRTISIEWREEHEDNLLHETLLCLKGLSTTSLALQRLDELSAELFPTLLKMLFDPERKGPSEYSTRGVVVSLLFSYLSATLHSDVHSHQQRARQILAYLRDSGPEQDKQPLEFVTQMHVSRPYRVWGKEVTNVTKEVFWIFLHHMNVVPILDTVNEGEVEFVRAFYPAPRAPHPAAPYVGGVEWEATQYLAAHLDLLNGLIASLPTREERNLLREEMKQSGWEKVMGGSLRTCKEKFYAAVHDGLKAWVAAGKRDGWYIEDVRAGPPREAPSPKKGLMKKGDEPPRINLDVGVPAASQSDEGWL